MVRDIEQVRTERDAALVAAEELQKTRQTAIIEHRASNEPTSSYESRKRLEIIWELRRLANEQSDRAQELDAELHRITQGVKTREILNAEGEMLDVITRNAPWRQHAFTHQIEGAKQLAIAGRGILGDKRGLGKTLTSIIWLDMLRVKKTIIFTSKEASTAFRKQMPRWAPHRSLFDLTSKGTAERNAVLQALHFVEEWTILINFEAWRHDWTLIEKLVGLAAQAVIIDEAHGIKEPKTSAYRGVQSVVYPSDTPALCSVKHVLPMSGTLFLNYPDELWPLIQLADRNDLSWYSLKEFRSNYLVQGRQGRWVFDKKRDSKAELLDTLGIRFVQRDREDTGVEIPPQEIVTHDIEFTALTHPRQYKAYRDLETKSAMLMSGMTDSQVVGVEGIALFTRLRQMLTWPQGISLKDPESGLTLFKCDIAESVKIDFAETLIKRIVSQEGDRVVLFSQFRAPLRELQVRLQRAGIQAVVLDGSTGSQVREAIKRDFDGAVTAKGNERWSVVLANYKVAGQSLDFTAAQQMVILDREWNPGRHDQAYGRIDRIGQTRNTTVHILNTPDTVDDVMAEINDTKADEYGLFEGAIRAASDYLKGK
jgi:SWI/SNF-related matrix-associated actin-dependent regulator 1 of chromatin subfamily A